eukprot:TRINITY_DN37430_c0_g1_i1.p1 TRINITY_DN37430_c0_g1~~TRINITY_DN37430_c0_g1_i1.p1  ORF type:complete len:619 (+),score=135.49 TRINITY_DN37430_c0_g1_i1:85-1941(+)
MDTHAEEQLRLHLFGSVHDAFETCVRVQFQMREDLCRSIDIFLAQANGVPVCSTPLRKNEVRKGCEPVAMKSPALRSLAGCEAIGHDALPPVVNMDPLVPEERAPMRWNGEVFDSPCIDQGTNSEDRVPSLAPEGRDDDFGRQTSCTCDSLASAKLKSTGAFEYYNEPRDTIITGCSLLQTKDNHTSGCDTGEDRRPMCSRVGLEVARRLKPAETAKKPFWSMSAFELLESNKFDNCVGALILFNAVTIGIQADHAAQSRSDDIPAYLRTIDFFFCAAFTAELSLRLYVMRCRFFVSKRISGLVWNYFDFFIVMAQLLEEVIALLSSSIGVNTNNLRILRVLRILRLVRVLRVMRVLRLVSELRTIVSSILGSFKSLFWTMVLLTLMIYIVGVYFTQCVTNHLVERTENAGGKEIELTQSEEKLEYYFGSLARTLLTLWEAIAGGEDWDRMAMPLAELQIFVCLVFVCYIAFALLALMNVVTGFFVHTALLRAKKEEEAFVADQIVNLFNLADENMHRNERLTEEDIVAVVSESEKAAEWKVIDILPEEARYLFRLLDVDGLGSVQFEEFMSGCLRLKGQAQSMDLLTVLQEQRISERRREAWQKLVLDQLIELQARS